MKVESLVMNDRRGQGQMSQETNLRQGGVIVRLSLSSRPILIPGIQCIRSCELTEVDSMDRSRDISDKQPD